jgi:hypothetical protein
VSGYTAYCGTSPVTLDLTLKYSCEIFLIVCACKHSPNRRKILACGWWMVVTICMWRGAEHNMFAGNACSCLPALFNKVQQLPLACHCLTVHSLASASLFRRVTMVRAVTESRPLYDRYALRETVCHTVTMITPCHFCQHQRPRELPDVAQLVHLLLQLTW